MSGNRPGDLRLKFPSPRLYAQSPPNVTVPTNSSASLSPSPSPPRQETHAHAHAHALAAVRLHPPRKKNQPATEQFPDGAHVRLQSRIEGAYVYANEDGYGVSMSPHGASLNAVWAVHRLVRRGTSYVLLHGAAYGRYLSITREDAPRGYGRIVQRLYDDPRRRDFLWVPVEDEDGTRDVVLHNRRHGPWRRFEHPDEEISWMVEAIPPRQGPPELPPAVPPPMVPLGGTMIALPQRRGLPRLSRRSIRYGRATDQEGFNPLVWSTLWFVGQSVSLLRRDIANALGEHDELNIRLCVRGGSEGRLTPLVIDLPRDEQTMEIVVFTTGSQAATELVYPDADAQQQQH